MSREFFYCAELSDRAGEQPVGTASTGDAWLLLEYTRPWGYKAFQESDLSHEVKERISRVLKEVPRSRILFIKRERETEGPLNLFIVRSQESETSILRFGLDSYEQLSGMNLEALMTGRETVGGESFVENLFLVCTHGKRDKCCAKFGFALYKALSGSDKGANVWQSSHVGGDRFAANLLCFPHGLFYAHVTEETGRRILFEYFDGRMVLENYRGRACYPSPIQAAEYFIRRESGLLGLEDLRFLDYSPIRDRNWRARFRSPADGQTHEVYLTSRLSEFQNLLTCHSTAHKRVVQYALDEYRARP